ncbi:MAG: hypothetical protein LC674_03415, partial [Actinobacteria bacterium]|nr:hypothetical protein [Actinomycetota bacterium]
MHQVPEDGLEESANGSVATGQRAYTFERYGHHVGLDKKCLLMEDSCCRVGTVHCCTIPPSELCLPLSQHTAQANYPEEIRCLR